MAILNRTRFVDKMNGKTHIFRDSVNLKLFFFFLISMETQQELLFDFARDESILELTIFRENLVTDAVKEFNKKLNKQKRFLTIPHPKKLRTPTKFYTLFLYHVYAFCKNNLHITKQHLLAFTNRK